MGFHRCKSVLLSSVVGALLASCNNGVCNTSSVGVLQVSKPVKELLYTGESTTATVSLVGSSGVSTPVLVTVTSENPNDMTVTPYSCSLTSAVNSCQVTLTALKAGEVKISASADGYAPVTSKIAVVIKNMFAYIINDSNDALIGLGTPPSDGGYTQCNVGVNGIESASCTTNTSSIFSQPSAIAFNKGYAYFVNYGDNSYVYCLVNESGIESETCAKVELAGATMDNSRGIAFAGNYAYITNTGIESYVQCNVTATGLIESSTCTDVALSNTYYSTEITIESNYAYIMNSVSYRDYSYLQCVTNASGLINANSCNLVSLGYLFASGGLGSVAAPATVAFSGTYSYMTDSYHDVYIQCSVGATGVESNNCIKVSPKDLSDNNLLDSPMGVAFNNSFAYFVNRSNNYTQCNVSGAGLVESASCANYTPSGIGALNRPNGIAFYGL
ncbi:MAG: hypothetical protein EKK57_08645 [Proteobacteria bacterium]|nr:MAG: hypothetical protein EKK57_08645 [Pseudomonadota bacterium]